MAKSWWKGCNPLYYSNHKAWRSLCYGMGSFANFEVGDLHKGKLNKASYHSILLHHAIPTRTRLVGQGFVLMQDNYLKHISKLCQSYIKSKEEQHILQLMFWLAQSADLNPIELVWDEHDQKVRAKQVKSVAHLWQLLQESWEELSSVYF